MQTMPHTHTHKLHHTYTYTRQHTHTCIYTTHASTMQHKHSTIRRAVLWPAGLAINPLVAAQPKSRERARTGGGTHCQGSSSGPNKSISIFQQLVQSRWCTQLIFSHVHVCMYTHRSGGSRAESYKSFTPVITKGALETP